MMQEVAPYERPTLSKGYLFPLKGDAKPPRLPVSISLQGCNFCIWFYWLLVYEPLPKDSSLWPCNQSGQFCWIYFLL
jgi:hypothetical protein